MIMRKQLQKTPLDVGNRWAVILLTVWVGVVAGWIAHAWWTPYNCYLPSPL
jgi:hypothetical protein